MHTTDSTRINTTGLRLTPIKAKGSKATVQATQAQRASRKVRQSVARIIGGIASLLVGLSVWHLTAGISVLTGSPVFLALLLAIGIDLGLITSELAEMVAPGNSHVSSWARAYMTIATVMSMALNAFEFSAHAPATTISQVIAISFGILLPAMIFILARIAAHLYQSR